MVVNCPGIVVVRLLDNCAVVIASDYGYLASRMENPAGLFSPLRAHSNRFHSSVRVIKNEICIGGRTEGAEQPAIDDNV